MRTIAIRKKETFRGHRDAIYTLEPSDIDHMFFSGAGDGMVVAWDLTKPDKGELVAKLPNSVYALHFMADARILAIGHNYDGVHFIKWPDNEEVGSLKFTEAAIFDIRSFGNKLFVGDAGGVVHVLSLNPLKVIDRIKAGNKSVRSIAVSEDNEIVAVGTSDNTIKIFDLYSHEELQAFEAHANSVFTLQFTPDEQYLLSAGRDAHLKVWDVKAGFLLAEDIVAHMYTINDIAFSPDGRYFVTCSMDKSVKVWDAERLKLLKVIDKARHAGHGTSVNKLLWSAHENLLASASDDRTISIWNIDITKN